MASMHACVVAVFGRAKGKTNWSSTVPYRESIENLKIKKKK